MAKEIKYKFLSCEVNHGTKENPNIEQIFLEKSMGWSEVNEVIAATEAYNGEYTIEDDGAEENRALTMNERMVLIENKLKSILSILTDFSV